MKNRKSIGWTVILVVAVIASAGWLIWPSSEASRKNPKALKHFRVVASYVYKGEPVEFDVVAECRYWTDGYIAESISRGFRVPYLYGHRMPDGAALFMALPYVCFVDLETDVNAEFMPLTFLAEDADDLSLFTAYVSDAGYAGPDDRLQFVSARLEKASQEDRISWEGSTRDNVINADNDPWKTRNRSQGGKLEDAVSCHGVLRYPIAEEDRAVVQALWPAHKPLFWSTRSGSATDGLLIKLRKQLTPAAQLFNQGIVRSDGTGLIRRTQRQFLSRNSVPLIVSWGKPFIVMAEYRGNHAIYEFNLDGESGKLLCYASLYNTKRYTDNKNIEYTIPLNSSFHVDKEIYSGDFAFSRVGYAFDRDKYIVRIENISSSGAEKGRME